VGDENMQSMNHWQASPGGINRHVYRLDESTELITKKRKVSRQLTPVI
jgi:hypothetical protein